MKKVFGVIAGLFFALFGLGVIGLVMSLTYSGLQRIFPNNFTNQMWGLVIFDIATIAWALAFAFRSYSLGQYGAAGAGFLVGLAGTGMMIYSEVTLSGQSLTGGAADTAQIGQWMIYAFIIGSLVHLVLLYMHHAASPELAQQISTGVAQGIIRDKARHAAEKQLEIEGENLARAITESIVEDARRDLRLPHMRRVIDLPALPIDNSLHTQSNGYPLPGQKNEPSFFRNPRAWFEKIRRNKTDRRYQQVVPQVLETEEITAGDRYAVAWDEQPDGSRVRWWCLICKDEGKEWDTPTSCEHVLKGKGQVQMNPVDALEMYQGYLDEDTSKPSMDARSDELENKHPRSLYDALQQGIKEAGREASPSPFRKSSSE